MVDILSRYLHFKWFCQIHQFLYGQYICKGPKPAGERKENGRILFYIFTYDAVIKKKFGFEGIVNSEFAEFSLTES